MTSRVTMFIHASLSLLLPLFLALLLTGCEFSFFGNQNKKSSMDYGPETSPTEIVTALQNAVKEYDANTMRVGEFAQIDQTQQINGQKYLISDMAQNVVSEEDEADHVSFRVVENRRYFDRDLKVTNKVDTEFAITFEKASASALTASAASPQMFGDPFYRMKQAEQQMQQQSKDNGVTYHKLETSMTLQDAPAGMNGAAKIRVYKLSYDTVFWEAGKGEVLHREYVISPDVPYLSVILEECLSGVLPVEKDRIFVKECTTANSFKFGTQP